MAQARAPCNAHEGGPQLDLREGLGCVDAVMRRVFPLLAALVCLLVWGMLPARGAYLPSREVHEGRVGERVCALPLMDLEEDSQPSGAADEGGAGDLHAAAPLTLAPALDAVRHAPARLVDLRAKTLVGTVVLLI